MRLCWLRHVPFEGLGYIETWAAERGDDLREIRLFEGEALPEAEEFDGLIVMGGPMGIHDHDEHPWLVAEKTFIKQAIDAGKTVLGVCLGAQLMADVLGARVYPGPKKEIGWFPIRRVTGAPEWIPEELTVFHWHGDTFDLPAGATALATSAPGINQGFIHQDHAVGLQFHMETTRDSMNALIENCGHELVVAPFIQSEDALRAGAANIATVNAAMKKLLDALF